MGHVAVADARGKITHAWGDRSHIFFLRSAAKPFQATVCQELGAGLSPVQLAVAAASHSGEPVHIAVVRSILAEGGLDKNDLRCPPSRPLSPQADRALAASGDRTKAPVLHNCSGKHAAMLRACLAQGWPLNYRDPAHPLQRATVDAIFAATGDDPEPVGIDHCGVPTLRTTISGMARAYARLANADRYTSVATAMHRYPALTAGTGRPESAIATATSAAVKGGAMGSLGIAVIGGAGVAVKASDGRSNVAASGAIAALELLRHIPSGARDHLDRHVRPRVLGGGDVVGHLEPALDGQT